MYYVMLKGNKNIRLPIIIIEALRLLAYMAIKASSGVKKRNKYLFNQVYSSSASFRTMQRSVKHVKKPTEVCVCVCMYVCICVCVCACVRVCAF